VGRGEMMLVGPTAGSIVLFGGGPPRRDLDPDAFSDSDLFSTRISALGPPDLPDRSTTLTP